MRLKLTLLTLLSVVTQAFAAPTPTPAPTLSFGGVSDPNNGYYPSQVIKAAPGTIFTVTYTPQPSNAVWILLFNKTTAPAEFDVPLASLSVASGVCGSTVCGSTLPINFGVLGLPFNAGISWALSNEPGRLVSPAQLTPAVVTVTYQ